MFVSTDKFPEASLFTNPAEARPTFVRADEVEAEVRSVADDGIVVPFTEVTFGNDVVSEVIRVALEGILVPLTVVRFGSEVVAVVTRVALDGIVVPLIDVAVATPSEGVVKEGLTNGAYEAN